MSDLESFRLDAAALAEIDRQIAAAPVLDPRAMVGILKAAPPDVTVDIPRAIMLCAMHHRCSAAEAQDELFAAMRSGELEVKMP